MSCPNEDGTTIEGNIRAEGSRESLNSPLLRKDISPLKLHGISAHSRIAHGKQKMVQFQAQFQKKQSDF